MSKKNTPDYSHLPLSQKLLAYVENEKLTTDELAFRLYNEDDFFTRSKVLSLISGLRRMGIDMFPDDGLWTIPETAVEFKKFVAHKKKCHFSGFVRMIEASYNASERFHELQGIKTELLGEVKQALKTPNHAIPRRTNKAR